MQQIVCYGDSLTHGYVSSNGMFMTEQHPYATRLQELCQLPCLEFGVNGMTAMHMASEEEASLSWALSLPGVRAEPYAVVILGGTNDLHSRRTAQEITQLILQLHQHALDQPECRMTFACTIPETGADAEEAFAWATEKRKAINAALREYAESEARVHMVDIAARCPQHPPALPADQLDTYWCKDRLHMTAAGYERMAEVIFEQVKRFLPL